MKNGKDKKGKTSYILTKETMGMTVLLFSAIVFLMLLTGSAVFAGIGKAICTFLYGTFGYGSWLIIFLTAYLGEWLVFGKKIKVSLKTALAVSLVVFCAFLLFHSAVTRDYDLSTYGGYISACYENAVKGFSGYTFGGVISAIVVYPFAKLTTYVGALIIFSLLTVASGYLLFVVLRKQRGVAREVRPVQTDETEETAEQPVRVSEPAVMPAPEPSVQVPLHREAVYTRKNERSPQPEKKPDDYGRKILFAKGEFDAESYRRNMIFNEDSYFNHPVHNKNDYLSSFTSGDSPKPITASSTAAPAKSYSESYQEEVLNQPSAPAPVNYNYGDKPVETLSDDDIETYSVKEPEETYEEPEEPVRPTREEARRILFEQPAPATEEDEEEEDDTATDLSSALRREERQTDKDDDDDDVDMYKLFGAASASRSESRIEPDITRLSSRRTERSNANLFDDDDDDDDEEEFSTPSRAEDRIKAERAVKEERKEVPSPVQPKPAARTVQPAPQPVQPEQVKQEEKPKHVWKKYVRPGLDLLDDYPEHSNVNTGEIEDNKSTIVETLARFKIESEVSNVIIGPAVTRYDVIIEDKTKITQSLKYKEAIAMALMKDNLAAYLNYSKGALSIEVPNNKRTIIGLKSMLTSRSFINCKQNSITFALGKNVEGEVMCPDITKMPHLLVAGTTGSGKSICLSSLIISLLYKYGPEELRFILVDPKQVEFISYDKLPHLMINEIIYEVDKAIKALNWAIKEMERRYSLFKEMTENGTATKNLDEYNSHLPEGEEKLPKIVIILDEFGDLMLQSKKDIESRIIKLVQKARACGIHLILATQRPSVDCITGLIKSNLPTRIGFKVNSFDDSRTIFDIGGAEKLLGKGDMYFRSSEYPDLLRIQGCFVDSHEIQKVTDFIKAHNETYFDQSVSDFINKVEEEPTAANGGGESGSEGGEANIDETYIKALYYCITSNTASVSMIQRRFPVGYIKACKIIDWMENMNYITQSEGSKPRKVLFTKDEFLNTYGEIDD